MVKDYYGLSPELVTEVGRIAVMGARLEERVYDVADALALEVRHMSATQAADEVKRQVKALGVPWWARATAADVRNWCGPAKAALNERHGVIHAARHSQRDDRHPGWRPVDAAINGRAQDKARTSTRYQAIRRRLEDAERKGHEVWLRLLVELAPRTYMHGYGPLQYQPVFTFTDPQEVVMDQRELEALIHAWWLAARVREGTVPKPPQDDTGT